MEDKVYVEVDAKFTPDGQLRPLQVIWEDGRSKGYFNCSELKGK